MTKTIQQSLINDGKPSGDELTKVQSFFEASLEKIREKVLMLAEKNSKLENENTAFKENIRELSIKINDLKIQLTKLNSDTVHKDKEISNLKSMIMFAQKEKTSIPDKDKMKSRIKDLITRIDTHLEQYDEDTNERD